MNTRAAAWLTKINGKLPSGTTSDAIKDVWVNIMPSLDITYASNTLFM
jgi:hypothetical protein